MDLAHEALLHSISILYKTDWSSHNHPSVSQVLNMYTQQRSPNGNSEGKMQSLFYCNLPLTALDLLKTDISQVINIQFTVPASSSNLPRLSIIPILGRRNVHKPSKYQFNCFLL
ncbi:hypothetical protein YC2023_048949 [Brassica napus]